LLGLCNELGYAYQVSAPEERTINTTPDQFGNVTKRIDAQGHTYLYNFDTLGRLDDETQPRKEARVSPRGDVNTNASMSLQLT